jgi:hypothetical protein
MDMINGLKLDLFLAEDGKKVGPPLWAGDSETPTLRCVSETPQRGISTVAGMMRLRRPRPCFPHPCHPCDLSCEALAKQDPW